MAFWATFFTDFAMPQHQQRIYFDNAATTFPKPPEVLAAMAHYAQGIGASAGRGAYGEAQESGHVLHTCRERLNALFHGENPNHFIFTLNCTDALNLAIQGMLNPGDHAITTWMDHNSVLRPLNALEAAGVRVTRLPVDRATGLLDPADIKKALTPHTRLVAVAHGSNVTGTLQAVREIGAITRPAGVPLLVDAAQTAGHVPIDVQADQIDLLAFPGHKGLMGPLGTGALYVRPGLEKRLRPLRYGGTGSISEWDVQPDFMPDKFESGSHNAIGIAGLSAGVQWILNKSVNALWEHQRALISAFMEGVDNLENLRYFGPQTVKNRLGVFSVRIDDMDPPTLAARLEHEFGILTRAGLHCAPLAHRTIGTIGANGPVTAAPAPAGGVGTTRFSFGPFLTCMDVQYACDALASIAIAHQADGANRAPQAALL